MLHRAFAASERGREQIQSWWSFEVLQLVWQLLNAVQVDTTPTETHTHIHKNNLQKFAEFVVVVGKCCIATIGVSSQQQQQATAVQLKLSKSTPASITAATNAGEIAATAWRQLCGATLDGLTVADTALHWRSIGVVNNFVGLLHSWHEIYAICWWHTHTHTCLLQSMCNYCFACMCV